MSELKARLRTERAMVTEQLRTLVPQARRAAVFGSFAWGTRKVLPLLQPLVMSLAGKSVGKTMPGRLIKIAGLAVAAFGVWRLSRPED